MMTETKSNDIPKSDKMFHNNTTSDPVELASKLDKASTQSRIEPTGREYTSMSTTDNLS